MMLSTARFVACTRPCQQWLLSEQPGALIKVLSAPCMTHCDAPSPTGFKQLEQHSTLCAGSPYVVSSAMAADTANHHYAAGPAMTGYQVRSNMWGVARDPSPTIVHPQEAVGAGERLLSIAMAGCDRWSKLLLPTCVCA